MARFNLPAMFSGSAPALPGTWKERRFRLDMILLGCFIIDMCAIFFGKYESVMSTLVEMTGWVIIASVTSYFGLATLDDNNQRNAVIKGYDPTTASVVDKELAQNPAADVTVKVTDAVPVKEVGNTA